MHTLISTPASTITLIEAEALAYARIKVDEQVIYEGSSVLPKSVATIEVAGILYVLSAADAPILWEKIREIFRKLGTPLIFKRISYSSPFPEDLGAVVAGTITQAEFAAYPETTVRSTTAQDGTAPADGYLRAALLYEAIAKLAAADGGAVATPRVHILHALLTAVKEYSRCHNGLHALGGLGLEAALAAAEEVVAAPTVTEHSISIRDYKPLLAAVALR